jgi:hypothetical protein
MEITSSSGEIIKISKAEGKLSWSLYSKLLAECLKHDIKLNDIFDQGFKKLKSLGSDVDIKDLSEQEIPSELLDKMLQVFMIVSSSDEIRSLFVKCVERSMFGNNKITEDILNENPEDYNLIFFACLRVNILPFFLGIKGLLSNIFNSGT